MLAPNLRVVGNLESEGDLQIDGTVDGDVRTVKLTVGKSAVVNGSIYGEEIRIAGTVNGEITARTVILLDSAKVTGDINHDSLSIEAGAYVQGLCKRVDVEVLKPRDLKPVDPPAGKDQAS
ncbi:bactofilin family protein [Aestuariispira ectoiniformans]|uniref:bactofilin family protein n=1 Tax=Aestuariispira ectoiniformans TaxID=2775080 RepID=UPI00223B473D|nr:polymer-forming cytoskeletal protein [Aestuariispira ectoiniformans]